MSRDYFLSEPDEDEAYDGDECIEPDEYLPEDIDDAQVRWSVGADGVGRVEVTW